ncbi:MAG: hypothetical protein RR642_14130 [Solibacillus sp.]
MTCNPKGESKTPHSNSAMFHSIFITIREHVVEGGLPASALMM